MGSFLFLLVLSIAAVIYAWGIGRRSAKRIEEHKCPRCGRELPEQGSTAAPSGLSQAQKQLCPDCFASTNENPYHELAYYFYAFFAVVMVVVNAVLISESVIHHTLKKDWEFLFGQFLCMVTAFGLAFSEGRKVKSGRNRNNE